MATGKAEKSSPGTRQTDCNNWIWFGEIERKLAKLSMPTFTYLSPLNYFMPVVLAASCHTCLEYHHLHRIPPQDSLLPADRSTDLSSARPTQTSLCKKYLEKRKSTKICENVQGRVEEAGRKSNRVKFKIIK
jgi:hypothetical protein